MRTVWRASRLVMALMALSATAAAAQDQVFPAMPEIPAAQDVAYPGTIRILVDATDVLRGIFRVRQTVPVAGPGPLTLLYPKWLPGNHAPTGSIDKFAGLEIRANGERLEWRRDAVDMHAFHVAVPAGVAVLEIEFDYLSPVESRFGRVVMTPDMLNLQWASVALYPAGHFASRIMVEPRVRLPEGWQFGTALETNGVQEGVTLFKPVSLETLVDSPMFAGRHFRRISLGSTGDAPVHLNIVADKPEFLNATPEQVEIHRRLVTQAFRLFGSHPYDHYDFLLALSDRLGEIGLEHHRSSENAVETHYFTEWDKSFVGRDLLAHEFVHSWNGKFRRGADLLTPDFRTPMRNSLLWLYEGQTQYWGNILAARSGLLSKEQVLDVLASMAAVYDVRIGRNWRPLEDTTNEPIISYRNPVPWISWQRSRDYYSEGLLIWLDADTLIRDLSKGRKSLDDFAAVFFRGRNGSHTPVAYDFEDVVATLNAVQPHDWRGFLRARLAGKGGGAPLDGLVRGGYRLVYTAEPTAYVKTAEGLRKVTDLTFSLGVILDKDGALVDVRWQGPAFNAGLRPGLRVIAVNGVAYAADEIKAAIKAAQGTTAPIELLLRDGDRFRTVHLDYHDGLRYPRLERIPGTADRLDAILTARR